MYVAVSYIEHDHRGSWACAVLCGGIICRNCNDFTGMRDLIAGDWLKIVHSRKFVAFFYRKSFIAEKTLQEMLLHLPPEKGAVKNEIIIFPAPFFSLMSE